MRRRVPGTAGLTGADRWDNIMEQILSPRRTAQLRAVLAMSCTTVASLIRSRCDPTAGRTPEPSSAPRPRRLREHHLAYMGAGSCDVAAPTAVSS
jgi:hypothetical protein